MTKLSPMPPRPSDPDNGNDLLIALALMAASLIALLSVIAWILLI